MIRIGRNPLELADILNEIYRESFGGKKLGRFRTSRSNFRKLAKLPRLSEGYLNDVATCLLKHRLILIDLDVAFCIFPRSATQSFRRVPIEIIKNYSEPMENDDFDEG